MIGARIQSESRATARADDAYTWLEDGVMDPSEGTHPWITEDIPAGRIRFNVARLVLPSTKEARPSHWGFVHRRSRAPPPGHSARPKDSPSVAPKE